MTLLIVSIAVIALFIAASNSGTPVVNEAEQEQKPSKPESPHLIQRSVRKYEIKGLKHYQSNWSGGDFYGYVKAEQNNPHDKYAVGIYVNDNRIGFAPKGNKRLHNTLMRDDGGLHPAWGHIREFEWNDRNLFEGVVFIPVNFCDEDREQLRFIVHAINSKSKVDINDIESILEHSRWTVSILERCNTLKVNDIIERVMPEHKRAWISRTVELTKSNNAEQFAKVVNDIRSTPIIESLTKHQRKQLQSRADKLNVTLLI